MKVISIGGGPCTGKTTLMRGVIKELGKCARGKLTLLEYEQYRDKKCIVLGSYAKKGFGGTDRLSMGVQPVALGVVQAWASDPNLKDWTILFEGDRLFNSSFLNSLEKIPGIVSNKVMLEASSEAQEKRHKERKDTQSETWLKGRLTKAKKLKESLTDLTVLKNETEEDLLENIRVILEKVGLK